jgi:hypothetical protein
MIDPIAGSPDELKAKVSILLNEPARSASTIYTSYVRPFGQFTGTFPALLHPADEIRTHPATIVKVRLFLYQLFVQLDVYAQAALDDPLRQSPYAAVLGLVRLISPLAVAIGGDVLSDFLSDLRTVHGHRWPLTIECIEDDMGFSQRDAPFAISDAPETRTHYREAPPVQPADSPQSRDSRGPALFRSRNPLASKTIHVRIKRTHRGPDPSSVHPLLAKPS